MAHEEAVLVGYINVRFRQWGGEVRLVRVRVGMATEFLHSPMLLRIEEQDSLSSQKPKFHLA